MRKFCVPLFFLIFYEHVPCQEAIKYEGRYRNYRHSLEYRALKPSYLSSGSNVGQIVPPGQPWPSNAAGYSNFSQINQNSITSTTTTTSTSKPPNVPQIDNTPQTSIPPVQLSDDQMIYLDFSNIDTDVTSELEEILADQLKIANKPTYRPEVKIIPLDITPPENSNSNYVNLVENSIKIIVDKYAPSATTLIRIEVTKTIRGIITNLRIFLNVSPPKQEQFQILPPATRPEIDLTQSLNNLEGNLREIVENEFLKNAGMERFSFSFNILPPEGSTRDFVKQKVLKTLQRTVRQTSPRATISSVSVNTLESNGRVLRQIINVNIRNKPRIVAKFGGENPGLIEAPEVNFARTSNISGILQGIVDEYSMANSGNKTLIIPVRTTAENLNGRIEDIVEILENILRKKETSGGITKVTRKVLENGDVVSTIHLELTPESIVYTSGTLRTTSTTSGTTTTTATSQTTVGHAKTSTAPIETTSRLSSTKPPLSRTTSRLTTTKTTSIKTTSKLSTVETIPTTTFELTEASVITTVNVPKAQKLSIQDSSE